MRSRDALTASIDVGLLGLCFNSMPESRFNLSQAAKTTTDHAKTIQMGCFIA